MEVPNPGALSKGRRSETPKPKAPEAHPIPEPSSLNPQLNPKSATFAMAGAGVCSKLADGLGLCLRSLASKRRRPRAPKKGEFELRVWGVGQFWGLGGLGYRGTGL